MLQQCRPPHAGRIFETSSCYLQVTRAWRSISKELRWLGSCYAAIQDSAAKGLRQLGWKAWVTHHQVSLRQERLVSQGLQQRAFRCLQSSMLMWKQTATEQRDMQRKLQVPASSGTTIVNRFPI